MKLLKERVHFRNISINLSNNINKISKVGKEVCSNEVSNNYPEDRILISTYRD
jgi:hypothetical protein